MWNQNTHIDIDTWMVEEIRNEVSYRTTPDQIAAHRADLEIIHAHVGILIRGCSKPGEDHARYETMRMETIDRLDKQEAWIRTMNAEIDAILAIAASSSD